MMILTLYMNVAQKEIAKKLKTKCHEKERRGNGNEGKWMKEKVPLTSRNISLQTCSVALFSWFQSISLSSYSRLFLILFLLIRSMFRKAFKFSLWLFAFVPSCLLSLSFLRFSFHFFLFVCLFVCFLLLFCLFICLFIYLFVCLFVLFDCFLFLFVGFIFSRVHVTLHTALSVGRLVGRSVGLSHFTFLWFSILDLTAPAQMVQWPQIWPLPTRTRLR